MRNEVVSAFGRAVGVGGPRNTFDPAVTQRPCRSDRPCDHEHAYVDPHRGEPEDLVPRGWNAQGNTPALPKDYQCRLCLTALDETELDGHVCPELMEMRNA